MSILWRRIDNVEIMKMNCQNCANFYTANKSNPCDKCIVSQDVKSKPTEWILYFPGKFELN